jgi:Protein of unknown function (DUF3830)
VIFVGRNDEDHRHVGVEGRLAGRTEVYGGCMFSSIVGQLAGNHFLTVFEGNEDLRPLGEMTLWEGAQDIVFARE